MQKPVLACALSLLCLLAACSNADKAPVPEVTPPQTTARQVFFVEPSDETIVPSTFTVRLGADGLTIEAAGPVREGAGHLHLLIDTDFIPAGAVIPKDEQHVHLGTGALETTLTLPPGPHMLRLQFADGAHTALDGASYRDEIHITVK